MALSNILGYVVICFGVLGFSNAEYNCRDGVLGNWTTPGGSIVFVAAMFPEPCDDCGKCGSIRIKCWDEGDGDHDFTRCGSVDFYCDWSFTRDSVTKFWCDAEWFNRNNCEGGLAAAMYRFPVFGGSVEHKSCEWHVNRKGRKRYKVDGSETGEMYQADWNMISYDNLHPP